MNDDAPEGLRIQQWLLEQGKNNGGAGTPAGAYLMKAARSLSEDGDRATAARIVHTLGTPTKKEPLPESVVIALGAACAAIRSGEHM